MNDPSTLGCLFLMRDRGLHLDGGAATSTLDVHGVTVHIAGRGEFRIRTPARSAWTTARAVVVPPDTPHEIDGRGAALATFLLIPETVAARRLPARLVARPTSAVEARVLGVALPRLRTYARHGCTNEEAAVVCDDLFAALGAGGGPPRTLDARLERALECVHSAASRLPVAAIARAASLSPSRFSHLFREQTGTTVAAYLAWRRLRAALDEMAGRRSLTAVAHDAGFTDSAHLTRTFRRVFGQPPSELLRHTRVVRTGL